MSEMTEQKAAELRKPFPPGVIGKKPQPYKADSTKGACDECGGWHGLPATHLDFVGHAATTDRILAVDPEWSWEPLAYTEAGLPCLDNSANLWIKLTICGVTRIGVGDGKNAKECIGDAIRNAAMRFGVALDLWSKNDLEQVTVDADKLRAALHPEPGTTRKMSRSKAPAEPNGSAPQPVGETSESPFATPEQIKAIATRMTKLHITDRDSALLFVNDVLPDGRTVATRKDLSRAEASRVIDALEADLTAAKAEA